MKRLVALVIGLLIVATVEVSAGTPTSAFAVAAASGRNVYVYFRAANGVFGFLRSVDGGATWKPVQDPGIIPVSIAASGSNVYIPYIQNVGLRYWCHVLRSTDRGATWERRASWSSDRWIAAPAIAASGERVDAFWEGVNDSKIYYSSSKDSGGTWTIPDNLPLEPNGDGRGILSVSREGDTLVVAWPEPPRGVGFFRQTLSDTFIYLEPRPTVARYLVSCDTGEFLSGLAWSETTGNGSGAIVATKLRATADGFSPQIQLSRGEAYNEAPVLKHSGSTVYALWRSLTADGKGSLRLARSLDAGTTWMPDRAISGTGYPVDQKHQLVAAGPNVYVFWWAFIQGANFERQDFLVRRSTDFGATWKPAKKLASMGLGVR